MGEHGRCCVEAAKGQAPSDPAKHLHMNMGLGSGQARSDHDSTVLDFLASSLIKVPYLKVCYPDLTNVHLDDDHESKHNNASIPHNVTCRPSHS